MSESPWITIIGLGEDGPDGLCGASREALEDAEIVMGPARHLALLGQTDQETLTWPVPFADGLPLLAKLEGRRVAVLASGDPFWFGSGSVIARHFREESWRAFPGRSTFSLAANALGWALEGTACLGLHAAPLPRMRPYLTSGAKLLVLLRDGAAVADLAAYLSALDFGESEINVFEALGGPRAGFSRFAAKSLPDKEFKNPVCAGIVVAGAGQSIAGVAGLPDAFFQSDGVMTKRIVRAITLSALAPRAGELLWDIGGGSGSVAIEWLLAHPTCSAISIEPRADRVALIRQNAGAMGVDRLDVVEGSAPKALSDLQEPNAVFVGGGLSISLLIALEGRLTAGTRLVANAVTLEAEALLSDAQKRLGGELLRLDVSQLKALGAKRAWDHAYPIVQWSVVL
ncbi:MAG: precorrin-6y C5,15-methyltransferase (decarboxylating) subunit CbiE [Pseudomonadota bacterium]